MSIADEGRILYARRADAWVLRFEGAIRYTGAHALDTFLDSLFARQDPASICVDLSAATSIDSTGIGMLAKVANGLRQSGKGKPVLLSTNPEITELLVNLCLDEVCLIVTEGVHAPAAETIPSTTPSEREVARTVLEAHRLLSGLSDQNRETFVSVVDALEDDLGESTPESPPSRRNT
jgi:anti-anti-sigma factor